MSSEIKRKNDLKGLFLLKYKITGVLIELFAPLLSDKQYLKLLWKHLMGYSLNLEHPRTFNEKLQWLKLYNRRPEYTQMVDKIEAKKYVASIIGEEHIIPTLAVYEKVTDIDFDKLPNQFVLKCSHDSGGIVICKDKSKLDKHAAIDKLRKGLKSNFFYMNREWPYKNVRPRIIAERFMSDGDNADLFDYKFMCYNGECKNLFVCTGRSEHDLRVDFYDLEWKHLPFYRKYKNADRLPTKPSKLSEMIELSNKLARVVDAPFVRIDFYQIKNMVYFGEITFFPGSGYEKFYPEEWDEELGKMIELPIC